MLRTEAQIATGEPTFQIMGMSSENEDDFSFSDEEAERACLWPWHVTSRSMWSFSSLAQVGLVAGIRLWKETPWPALHVSIGQVVFWGWRRHNHLLTRKMGTMLGTFSWRKTDWAWLWKVYRKGRRGACEVGSLRTAGRWELLCCSDCALTFFPKKKLLP